jgi:hypothetical protein
VITIAELRKRIATDRPDVDLARLRDSVIRQAEGFTARSLNAFEDQVATYTNRARRTAIYLRPMVISEVSLVEVWHQCESPTDAETITEYWLESESCRIARNDGSPWPFYVRVTATGGYDDDTVPPDLKDSLLMQAEFMVTRNESAAGKLISRNEGFAGGSNWYHNPGLHPQVKEVWGRYRLFAIGSA